MPSQVAFAPCIRLEPVFQVVNFTAGELPHHFIAQDLWCSPSSFHSLTHASFTFLHIRARQSVSQCSSQLVLSNVQGRGGKP